MLLIYAIFVTLLGYENIKYSEANPITGLAVNGTILSKNLELIKVKGNKHYYISLSSQGTWFEALQYCRFHDMDLISLDTLGDRDRFVSILPGVLSGLTKNHWFWTSGNKGANKWVWLSSGKPLTYQIDLQTDKKDAQAKANLTDCLAFLFDFEGQQAVKWYPRSCVEDKFQAHPICESFSGINAAATIEIVLGLSVDCYYDDYICADNIFFAMSHQLKKNCSPAN